MNVFQSYLFDQKNVSPQLFKMPRSLYDLNIKIFAFKTKYFEEVLYSKKHARHTSSKFSINRNY